MTTENNTAGNMTVETVSADSVDLSSFVDPTQGSADMPTINPQELERSLETQQERGAADSESLDNKDKQVTPEKTSGATKQEPSSATASEAKPDTTRPRSKAAERLEELMPKLKEANRKIAELEKKLASQPKPEKKSRIPKPEPPSKYTREQLDQLEAHYDSQNDRAGVRAVQAEIKKLDKYENDLRFWALEDGQAEKEYDAHKSHYVNLARDKYKGYEDPESEIGQHYGVIVNKVIPKDLLAAVQEHPMGEYLMASIAELRRMAFGAAALGDQLKKAQEEIASYKDKAQPLKPSTIQKAGAEKSDEDPRKRFIEDLSGAFKERGI